MSLSAALQQLPDDRETQHAVRQVLDYIRRHPGEQVEAERVSIVSGLPIATVRRVFSALSAAFVIDCGTDGRACRYEPTALIRAEVDRYLVTADRAHSRLQGNVERFRGRYGR